MELQVLEQNAIVAAFAKRGGTDELFDRIAQEARSHVPDVTTKKGRDAIGSLAMKISKSKTIIEKYGKEVVAEQKAQIKLIDDDRISVVKKFDELRNEILAPRDAWEQAEKDRVAKHEGAIETIKAYFAPTFIDSENIKLSIQHVENTVIDSSYEEFENQAKIAKFETLELLKKALADREKYEAEQAELERLRQAEIERQQKERDEKIAREAADKARVEAEAKALADRKRVEQEKLEAEQREARLKLEKEQAELREQQLKQQAIEREKQAEIDRQKAVEAERLRIEQEAKAKEDAERKAEEARIANREHMRSIHKEVTKALLGLNTGLSDVQIKDLITAIAKNQIPHISIKY
ncbi:MULTISPECIES: hypothetical protein [Acinetobacter]|uniref:hypothetical protein n=1 Tax=Acinetobacter TaxID=469 RepID=UPI000CFFEB78|nr:hypothetical protein [Acinetobacter sp. MYb10]QLD61426.1 hypothetical protein CQZ96_009155 [Acinetobacter sp. MYb10]